MSAEPEIVDHDGTAVVELLPCPFCGGRNLALYEYSEESFFQCEDCTTTGPNGHDLESARLQWNTRYGVPAEVRLDS